MTHGVAPTRFGPGDAFAEARAALAANRTRTVASGLAVGVAATALVALLCVSATITNQVSADFNGLRATSVYLRPAKEIPFDGVVFPENTDTRLRTIAGVRAGGVVVERAADQVEVAATNVSSTATVEAQLIGVEYGMLAAIEGSGSEAVTPVEFRSGAAVALVGERLARRLGLDDAAVQAGASLAVDGRLLRLRGIIRHPQRLTESADGVVVSRLLAEHMQVFEPSDYAAIVQTASGAAGAVATVVVPTLAPGRRDPYVVDVPPEARSFRRKVEGNISVMVIAMAGLAAVIGAISIASTAYGGVVERTSEIGLRRAVGAKARHVAGQVLLETALTSSVAGLVGTFVGLAGSLVYGRLHNWINVVDPWLILSIPLAAVLLGLAAGLLPARRASRIEPAVALRQ